MLNKSCNCRLCCRLRGGYDATKEMRIGTFFIVCPVCGNKRCPKASNHGNDCAGSNKPGQPGSVYT